MVRYQKLEDHVLCDLNLGGKGVSINFPKMGPSGRELYDTNHGLKIMF
jgi:hypothetical protein